MLVNFAGFIHLTFIKKFCIVDITYFADEVKNMLPYLNRKLLPELVNEFIDDLSVSKDRSEATLNEYISDIRLFLRYMVSIEKELNSPDELPADYDLSYLGQNFFNKVTLRDVNNFLTYCKNIRKIEARGRMRKASALRGLFKFLSVKMHYIDKNPLEMLEVASSKKTLPRYLTLEQSKELLNSVCGKNMERDYCILTLFLNCGLRLAELVSLDVTDINFDNKTLIVTGKGNKERMVYLNKACINSLKAYLNVRPKDGLANDDARKALFISRLNKRIGRQAVQLMVQNYINKIGLEGQHYSVHKLRHTAATLMYRHGDVDVLTLKEVLGHENLSTTEIYTHIENQQIKDAISSNPLSKEKPTE